MRKLLIICIACTFFLPFLIPSICSADTAVCLSEDQDTVTGFAFDNQIEKGLIYCNPKGLSKTSIPFQSDQNLSWTSKYGSIVFSQWGQDLPYAGMNEQGLTIIRVPFDKPTETSQPSLESLQWIQYYLDQYQSITDLLSTEMKEPSFSIFGPAHYFISDINGDSLIIEWNSTGPVFYSTSNNTMPYPVLTDISYEKGISLVDATTSIEKENSAEERFKKAAFMYQEWKKADTGSLFLRLSDILINTGTDETQWNVLFHISEKRIYFRTYSHNQIKTIDLSQISFSCEEDTKYWEIDTDLRGDITQEYQIKAAKHDQSWESLNLATINGKLSSPLSLKQLQLITRHPYGYSCNMSEVKTDSDRLQTYSIWCIAITGLLAGLLFLLKGIQKKKENSPKQSTAKKSPEYSKVTAEKRRKTNKKKRKKK